MVSEDDPTGATRREGPGASAPGLPKSLARGDRVGRYVIEDVLGEGGMGVVYAALDPELVRKIALKVVRPGGGGDSQARLLREAQAMARLQHPNVVAIHDVGIVGAKVFIAMELVDGETLRRWLKREKRGWREVLAVFRDAGRGLAAAHAAGIVHRDFKLDNVLVDRKDRARVTDFGVARAIAEVDEGSTSSMTTPRSLSSPITQTGGVVGTVAYMAPEQRKPSSPADARADLYSYSVSLYEALYGERPFDKNGELRKLPASNVPAWIRRIVMRGLERDPALRWPSIDDMLDALAKDPSVRMKRIAIAAGAFALVGGAIAVVATRERASTCDTSTIDATWNQERMQAMRAAFDKTAKPFAASAFTSTRDAIDRVAGAWKTSRVAACRAKRDDAEMHLRVACLENQRAKLAALVELLVAADAKVVELAVGAAGTLDRPEDCDDVRSLALPMKLPADTAVRSEIETLRVQLAAASALPSVGRPREAIERYQPIAARAKTIGYRPLEGEASLALGNAYMAQGTYVEAVEALEASVRAAEAGHADRIAARAAIRLALAYSQMSKFVEAENAAARADTILERAGGDRVLEADLVYMRGIIDQQAARHGEAVKKFAEALEMRERLLGGDHVDTLLAHVNLGASYDELAMPREAIAHDEAGIRGLEKTLGSDHPRLIVVTANLAMVHMRIGELEQADRVLARAAANARASLGARSHKSGIVELYLSKLRLAQARPDDSLAHAREAGATFLESAGETSEPYGDALVSEGAALLALGKLADAITNIERGIAIRQAANPEMVALADDYTTLAHAQLANGNAQAALKASEAAMRLSKGQTRYPAELARTRSVHARALRATGAKDVESYGVK